MKLKRLSRSNISSKVLGEFQDLSAFIQNIIIEQKIVISTWHFYLMSFVFHFAIIFPLLFELFIYQEREVPYEAALPIIMLDFKLNDKIKESEIKEAINKNEPDDIKSEKEDIAKLITPKDSEAKIATPISRTKPSPSKVKRILKQYEDHVTSKIAMVVEKNIDKYNINGEFLVHISMYKNGTIKKIQISKSSDKRSEINLKKIINKIKKFNHMPDVIAENKLYHFQIPIDIEQD